jgi:hypothetical protein
LVQLMAATLAQEPWHTSATTTSVLEGVVSFETAFTATASIVPTTIRTPRRIPAPIERGGNHLLPGSPRGMAIRRPPVPRGGPTHENEPQTFAVRALSNSNSDHRATTFDRLHPRSSPTQLSLNSRSCRTGSAQRATILNSSLFSLTPNLMAPRAQRLSFGYLVIHPGFGRWKILRFPTRSD